MIAPFNDKSLTNITPGKPAKALNQSRENGHHGPGFHVKVIRKDLATEDRRKKRKLKKAIMNLQNEDKHRDIDYKMNQHVQSQKMQNVNLNLKGEDFDDYDSSEPETDGVFTKTHPVSPSHERPRARSLGRIEPPKSR